MNWQMARYHFRLVDEYDVLRKLLTVELDNYEDVFERAELLAHLLLSFEDDWYSKESETRQILVTDDNGKDVLVVRMSDIRREILDH